jgi:hypothetical protein
MLVNSSLINEKPSRNDIEYIFVPLNELALEVDDPKFSNM